MRATVRRRRGSRSAGDQIAQDLVFAVYVGGDAHRPVAGTGIVFGHRGYLPGRNTLRRHFETLGRSGYV
jgi:hypothetical protein